MTTADVFRIIGEFDAKDWALVFLVALHCYPLCLRVGKKLFESTPKPELESIKPWTEEFPPREPDTNFYRRQ